MTMLLEISDKDHMRHPPDELEMVQTALEDIINTSVMATRKTAKSFGISNRETACVIALNRMYKNLRNSSFVTA